jgi:hypothetical protein
MLLIEIFVACFKRWLHCLWYLFSFSSKHRECSLKTYTNNILYFKIYCECGMIFGEWKININNSNIIGDKKNE